MHVLIKKQTIQVALQMKQLRNFDLTVEEIKLVKSINQLKDNLDRIQLKDPSSSRTQYLLQQMQSLEEKLEELRDNTLIR
jgi:hypothetical protein